MYKDIINYKLADGITEEKLLSIAKQIVTTWMTKQPGFIKWEINKSNNGDYTDIVYWNSEEDAKKAEAEMMNIPNANEWFSCYKEGSIKSAKLHLVGKFN